jgi:peroxiredoxin
MGSLMKAKILLVAALALAAGIAAGLTLSTRSAAPEVRFATLSGEQFSTSDLRGKVVLVNFWATWCTTCVQEMPRMIDTYRKFAPRGYEMVAVAVQSDHPNSVAAFAQKRALPFKVALDGDGNIAKEFGRIRITPTSFLLDKNGRVLKEYVGEPDWAEFHALVEKALAS